MKDSCNSAVKEYDTNHMINRLYVHWDVSTQCQFKCTYCYAMKEYGWQSNSNTGEWNQIDKWYKQKMVIHAVSKSTLPVFLGLLGGEPTIHPRYDELIDRCISAIDNKDQSMLYVTTNGLRGPGFFEKKKAYDKLMYLWSFHVEEYERYGKNFNKIIDSIRVCLAKGSRCRVNVMLHSDEQYWQTLHKFVDIIEGIDGVEIHPHWIYADGSPHYGTTDYNEKFYQEFKRFSNYPRWLTFEDAAGGKTTMNDYDIFSHDRINFKGWNCWHNNYEITWNGKVNNTCFPHKTVDLARNPYFFKNITEVSPVRCPHNCCACDGLLKIYKER